MKKLLALVLTLAMSCALITPALAAEAVTPTPPPWIKAEDYIVFSEGQAYRPGYWNYITQLRDDAAAGNRRPIKGDPLYEIYTNIHTLAHGVIQDSAANFELGLIEMMYHKNSDYYSRATDDNFFYIAQRNDREAGGPNEAKLALWSARSIYQTCYYGRTEEEVVIPELPKRVSTMAHTIRSAMAQNGLTTLDEFLDCGTIDIQKAKESTWFIDAIFLPSDVVTIFLDGAELWMDVPAKVRNERTMVPIRAVAEALGADVEWVPDTQKIVMTRAGSTVTMTLDSTVATVDGTTVEMDVAPYAAEGRTLVPARYVAEFFGQAVTWDGGIAHRVDIMEDKTVADGSNLEAWAVAMGAIRGELDNMNPERFGQTARTDQTAQKFQARLSSDWNIKNREDLIATIQRMTYNGHNITFQQEAAIVTGLSDEELAQLVAASNETGKYMWPIVKQLSEKWGTQGVLGWDLSRMSNLAQWGYMAGYITYAEALELIQPAAELTAKTFSSWEEFYENYLDGYNWWARIDMTDKDLWEWLRGSSCRSMLDDPELAPIFDDTLFQTGVIGLPE